MKRHLLERSSGLIAGFCFAAASLGMAGHAQAANFAIVGDNPDVASFLQIQGHTVSAFEDQDALQAGDLDGFDSVVVSSQGNAIITDYINDGGHVVFQGFIAGLWTYDNNVITGSDRLISGGGSPEFVFTLDGLASDLSTNLPATLTISDNNSTVAVQFNGSTVGIAVWDGLNDFAAIATNTLGAGQAILLGTDWSNDGFGARSHEYQLMANVLDIDLLNVWTGDGDTPFWTDADNWLTGNPAQAGEDVVLTGDGMTIGYNYPAFNFSNITLTQGAGDITIEGVGMGVETFGHVTNNSTNTLTFNLPFTFEAQNTVNANAGDIVYMGDVAINVAQTVYVTGDHDTSFSGVVSGAAAAFEKNGTGTLTLSGNNTITGGVVLNQGTLFINHVNALGSGTLNTAGNALDQRILVVGEDITLTSSIILDESLTLRSDVESATINSNISGTSKLILDSASAIALGGNNTFTGGVDFEQGLLVVTHNNALGTGDLRIDGGNDGDTQLGMIGGLNIANNITLNETTSIVVQADATSTLSGVITGVGSFTLNTGGHLVLDNANNAFDGPITIQGGTLSMTHQLLNSGIIVDGGSLEGEFGGVFLTANSGNISPAGDQIGTLATPGVFTLDGATWNVQFNDQGEADKITASQATLLSGTVLAKPAEVINQQRQYTILETTHGINGDPDVLTRQNEDDSFILDFSLAIDGNDLILTAIPVATFEDAAVETGNPELPVIGRILDDAVTNGNNSPQLAALQGLNGQQLTKAISQLQPRMTQAVTSAHMTMQSNVNSQWQSRTQQAHYALRDAMKVTQDMWLAQGPSSPGSNPGQESSATAAAIEMVQDNQPQIGKVIFFGKILNDFGRVDEDRFASGYSYNAHGADIGAQVLLTENFLLGGSGTVGVNRVFGHGDSGEAEAITLTANMYASYLTRNWHLDAGLSYGHAFNDTERPITALGLTAEGDYDSDILAATIGGGYIFDLKGWEIEPFAYVSYTKVIDESYTESGAGALNLSISENHTDSLKPRVGVRLGKRFEFNRGYALMPRVSAAYEYEVLENQVGVDANLLGGTFRNNGADISRHTLKLGAGGDIELSQDVSLFVDYVASLNSDYKNHSLNAGFRLSF